MSIVLGGYVLDENAQRHQIPVTLDPDDSVIEEALLSVKQASGAIGLRYQPEPESGPYELMLYSENGNFLLMLNEHEEDGDTNVRTINQADIDNELISILGECYPAKAITHDFQTICLAFKEFSDSGDVSGQLLR